MANWEKLDTEFYNVVNNLTDNQWQTWREQQQQNKIIRQQQKEMEMKMHLLKLSFLSFKGQSFLTEEFVEDIEFSCIENIETIDFVETIIKSHKYALAV